MLRLTLSELIDRQQPIHIDWYMDELVAGGFISSRDSIRPKDKLEWLEIEHLITSPTEYENSGFSNYVE